MNLLKEQWLKIKEINIQWIIASIVAFLLAVFIVIQFLWKSKEETLKKDALNEMEQLVSESSEVVSEESIIVENSEEIFVDVKGAIKKPGVYQMNSGDRLLDVIDIAGGLTNQADGNQLNLAQKLQDEMVIYIPRVDEEIPEYIIHTSWNESLDEEKNSSEQININEADLQELMQLSGIGEAKANNIITYRQEHGSFKSIEEIKNVSGIGDRIFEQLKDKISVN